VGCLGNVDSIYIWWVQEWWKERSVEYWLLNHGVWGSSPTTFVCLQDEMGVIFIS
jgi:hypothetical protein